MFYQSASFAKLLMALEPPLEILGRLGRLIGDKESQRGAAAATDLDIHPSLRQQAIETKNAANNNRWSLCQWVLYALDRAQELGREPLRCLHWWSPTVWWGERSGCGSVAAFIVPTTFHWWPLSDTRRNCQRPSSIWNKTMPIEGTSRAEEYTGCTTPSWTLREAVWSPQSVWPSRKWDIWEVGTLGWPNCQNARSPSSFSKVADQFDQQGLKHLRMCSFCLAMDQTWLTWACVLFA